MPFASVAVLTGLGSFASLCEPLAPVSWASLPEMVAAVVSRMKDRSWREMFPALSVAPSASAPRANVCNSGRANVNEPSERTAESANLDLGRCIGPRTQAHCFGSTTPSGFGGTIPPPETESAGAPKSAAVPISGPPKSQPPPAASWRLGKMLVLMHCLNRLSRPSDSAGSLYLGFAEGLSSQRYSLASLW